MSSTPATDATAVDQADDQDRPDFAVFLVGLDRGATNDELTKLLGDLVKAVRTVGKAGSLALTIKITPQKDVPDVVAVTTDVKARPPIAARPKTLRFLTEEGELTTEHPAQRALLQRSELEARR